MYAVDFTNVNGETKRRYFKTLKGAKQHYDKYTTTKHFWFQISMGELKKEFEPAEYIKEEWI